MEGLLVFDAPAIRQFLRTYYNGFTEFRYGSSDLDPLSDIIALLAPRAALSKPITGKGIWGIRYAAYRQPGFAIVLEGQCWLALEGDAPLQLLAGDFMLLPDTPAFTLSSEPGIACTDVVPSAIAIHHGSGDGPPDFRMFGGAFEIDAVNAPLLVDLLPRMIHVRARDERAGRLARIVDLVRDECEADRPGRDMLLRRLLEAMLVECLRQSGMVGAAEQAGLLAGMRDPALSRVLRAIHSDVRHDWTLAELSKLAGTSRTVLSARFQQVLKCAPIEYLGRWRMTLAKDALIRRGGPLERLAEEIGYQSASAFSTAFRKRVGIAPGAFAKRYRDGATASGAGS
jgi:AraC-like DNA-binding protein